MQTNSQSRPAQQVQARPNFAAQMPTTLVSNIVDTIDATVSCLQQVGLEIPYGRDGAGEGKPLSVSVRHSPKLVETKTGAINDSQYFGLSVRDAQQLVSSAITAYPVVQDVVNQISEVGRGNGNIAALVQQKIDVNEVVSVVGNVCSAFQQLFNRQ